MGMQGKPRFCLLFQIRIICLHTHMFTYNIIWQESGSSLDWFWPMISRETAVKILARVWFFESLIWPVDLLQVHSCGSGLKASVPYQLASSQGVYDIVLAYPQTDVPREWKWVRRSCCVFCLISEVTHYHFYGSHQPNPGAVQKIK